MKLIPATTEQDLNRVRNLYMVSFPDSERKPFDMILAMHETGNADILMMMDPDFSGLLITMKDDGLLLIDYLAVDPARSGSGSMASQARSMAAMGYSFGLADYAQPHYGYISFHRI